MNKRVMAIALIAFLGMVDTFYISIMRSQGSVLCHVTHGCNEVLLSRFSGGFQLRCSRFNRYGEADAIRIPAGDGSLSDVAATDGHPGIRASVLL